MKQSAVTCVLTACYRSLRGTAEKRASCLGSPCWMAPEVVASGCEDQDKTYDSRIDVWALGRTKGKMPLLPPFKEPMDTRSNKHEQQNRPVHNCNSQELVLPT